MSYQLSAALFWQLTPREVLIHIAGAKHRLMAEQNGRGWLAWHVAALSRVEKLPELDALINADSRPPKPQTLSEMERAADRLFLAMGGDPDQLKQVKACARATESDPA